MSDEQVAALRQVMGLPDLTAQEPPVFVAAAAGYPGLGMEKAPPWYKEGDSYGGTWLAPNQSIVVRDGYERIKFDTVTVTGRRNTPGGGGVGELSSSSLYAQGLGDVRTILTLSGSDLASVDRIEPVALGRVGDLSALDLSDLTVPAEIASAPADDLPSWANVYDESGMFTMPGSAATWTNVVSPLAHATQRVVDVATAMKNDPLRASYGVVKGVVNIVPETVNLAINATKLSLNGWSYLLGDGGASFRATSAWNAPVWETQGDAEFGGSLVGSLAGPGAYLKTAKIAVAGVRGIRGVGNAGSTAGTGAKLSFDTSLNVVDRAFGREAGSILAENGVGRASYARLQAQGTEVRFVNDAGMPEMGLFNPYDNTVTVNMLRHTSSNEVASTVVHEAVHQNRFFRSNIAPTTQYEEYLAFRNEYLFSEGRRPSLFERQQIMERVQDLYPHLPSGKKPFGGQ
jgi:hypothetical protein